GFFKNVVDGVGGGIDNFFKNIKQHLIKGLIGWLTGALSEVDITIPETFDVKGIFGMVMQILGLTYENIKAKVIKRYPPAEKVFAGIEAGIDFVKRLVTEGPIALWEEIKEAFSNFKEMVLSGIRDFVIFTVAKEAVTWLLGLLNPAGALVKVVKLLFDFVMFLIERFQQIVDFVKSVYDSVVAIASGNIGPAMKAVEEAMSRSLPVIISLLASLAGLRGIGKTVTKIIKKLTKPVNKALDKVIRKMIDFAKKLLGKAKKGAKKVVTKFTKWWTTKKSFKSKDGKQHKLFYKGEGKNAELHVASKPKTMRAWLIDKKKQINSDIADKAEKERLLKLHKKAWDLNKANIALESKINTKQKSPKRGKPIDKEIKKDFGQLKINLDSLAATVSKLFFENDPQYPPAILPPFNGGVRARGFTAQYISKKTPKGTTKTERDIPGTDTATKYGLGDNAAWVRMHLLPEGLGGKGKASNLVWAPGPGVNQVFRDEIEHVARDYKNGTLGGFPGKPDQGNLIWYQVKVKFGHTAPPTPPNISGRKINPLKHFPNFIGAEFGTYEYENGKWAKKPAPSGVKNSGKWSQTVPAPNLSGTPAPKEYFLDQSGEFTLRNIPGIGSFGRTIWFGTKRNFCTSCSLFPFKPNSPTKTANSWYISQCKFSTLVEE
ncbi:MAG: hypothetical protein AAFP19_26420, partial [Bacteroidota bacterium]